MYSYRSSGFLCSRREVKGMASTSYEIWMNQVDTIFEQALGVSYEDLPDQTYRTWHDEGWSAAEVVKEVLSREGWEC